MLSLHEFSALSNVSKSDYLRDNFPVNSLSRAMRKPVYGFGINDADYMSGPRIDGKLVRCPAYLSWLGMLYRAHCPKLHAKEPTYAGVAVCDEWRSFMTFRGWWIYNQLDGYEMDKDLLGDSREYRPESCIFVPAWLNSFTIDCGAARGDSPIGASWHKASGKYQAACSHPFSKKQLYLGLFTRADEAHAAWKTRKLEIAEEFKPSMDAIDPRIYPRVVEIIKRAK